GFFTRFLLFTKLKGGHWLAGPGSVNPSDGCNVNAVNAAAATASGAPRRLSDSLFMVDLPWSHMGGAGRDGDTRPAQLGLIRPTPLSFVNQIAPSLPTVSRLTRPVGLYLVSWPDVVTRAIDPASANHTAPSGPATRPRGEWMLCCGPRMTVSSPVVV